MIYISPTGSFDNPRPDVPANDAAQLVKVQIDNSLNLNWKKEDIILVTNFNYEYRNIKATVLKNVEFFERKPQASKINAIVELFNQSLIKDGELYWFHDLDAYQLQPITPKEIDIKENQIAVTDYGVSNKWSTGVIFFKSGSRDIFEEVKNLIYKHKINEELALGKLIQINPDIAKRVKKLNKSYNFTPVKLRHTYPRAIKPLKIAHFHIVGGNGRFEVKNPVAFFKGENELHIPLITERLIKILESHGIR